MEVFTDYMFQQITDVHDDIREWPFFRSGDRSVSF